MHLYLNLALDILSIVVLTSGQSCSKDKSCDTPSCCSEWGFCGFGPDFCGSSCVRDCNLRPECGPYSLTPECPLKVCCSQYGFCGTTIDFCQSQCQSNCNSPVKKTCAANSASVRVGYYASWARDRSCNPYFAKNINPRNYTHLNYAFGQISGGLMTPPTGTELDEIQSFVGLKLVNPALKTLISVGGWAFNDPGPTQQEFHNIILTSASRAKFINSVQSYLDSYSFDGIDIDYEYPTAPDRGGSPEDKLNFVQLVKEMRATLASKYLITIAAPASYWYLRNFAIGEMSKYLDFINVMTYDIHGTWDADIESLGPVVRSHTNIKEIESALELFLRDGVPSDKIVLGLAYYGRSFQLANHSCSQIGCKFIGPAKSGRCTNSPGTLAWFEINEIIASTGFQPNFDSDSMSKILLFDTDQWVAYDDEETLLLRQDYAGTNCLLGTMIWSIDQGVQQVSGRNALMRSGSLNINFVNLYVILYDPFGTTTSPRLYVESDYPFSGAEVDGTYVVISTQSTVAQSYCSATPTFATPTSNICSATPTPTSTPNTTTPPPLDYTPFTQFWLTISVTLNQDHGVYRAVIDDPTDPIQTALLRNIPGGFRVEFIEAFIFPSHLGQVRTNFGSADRTRLDIVLNANWDDQMGHLVASSLGGRPVWYNLVPQHPAVNQRNFGRRFLTFSWYDAEEAARRDLRAELVAGRLRSYIRWRVWINYDIDNFITGRPSSFSIEATMFINGVLPVQVIEVTNLCNAPATSLLCKRKEKQEKKDN